MVTMPKLVQEFNIRSTTNSVLVGTMKFTLDHFTGFFTNANPAPTKLAAQLTSFSARYDVLNSCYAASRESLITQDIAGLDEEGDQLELGFEGVIDASQRMTFDAQRKAAADLLALTKKKYKIDVRENMISEWSKIQQMTEEITESTQLSAAAATLGLTSVVARLAEIAALIPQKISERSAQALDPAAMKSAREAIYPEYRALIQVLNAYAIVDDDPTKYATLIRTLNDNIDYVRIHAITSSGSSSNNGGGSSDNGGGTDNGGGSSDNGGTTPDNPDTPDTPDTPDNPDTPDTPDNPDTPDPGNGGGGDNGGGSGDNGGGGDNPNLPGGDDH